MVWHVKLKARRWKFDGSQSHVAASRGSSQHTQTNTQIGKVGDHSEMMLDQYAWLVSELSTYAIVTLVISVAAAPQARASRSQAGTSRPGQLVEPSRAMGTGGLSQAKLS